MKPLYHYYRYDDEYYRITLSERRKLAEKYIPAKGFTPCSAVDPEYRGIPMNEAEFKRAIMALISKR